MFFTIMEPNFIIQHWEKQLTVFSENFLSLQKEISKDAVHDWRVAVKKLRSYAKLRARLTGKNENKKKPAPTDELFNVMGKYRDLQMSLALFSGIEERHKQKYPLLKEIFRITFSESQ